MFLSLAGAERAQIARGKQGGGGLGHSQAAQSVNVEADDDDHDDDSIPCCCCQQDSCGAVTR